MSERSKQVAQQCSGLFTEFESRLDRALSDLPSPGLNAAILVDDEVVWKYAIGRARFNPDVDLSTDHVHRIGSITKLFTATSILILCEEGKIGLDEPISLYLPEYTPRFPVTIRQILCHGGSIPAEAGLDVWNTGVFPDNAELLRHLKTCWSQPVDIPMTHLKYSNAAYAMLGLVVEATSGTSYEDFVTDRILQPLQMKDTVFHLTPGLEERFAHGHIIPSFQRRFGQAPHQELKAFSAAGMLASTTGDLLRFAQSQWSNTRLVSTETMNEMHRLHNIDRSWNTGWGLGWNLKRQAGKTFSGHGGGYLGNRNRLDLSREHRFAAAIYANCASAMGNYELPSEFLARMIEVVESKRPRLKADPPSPEFLAFLGNYGDLWGQIRIGYAHDGLRILPGELEGGDPLEHIGQNRFRVTVGRHVNEEIVAMEHGVDGRVVKIFMAGHILNRI